MKMTQPDFRARRAGLTLVEVMVAVTVGLIIVYVTFVIFDKTQKVWRAGRDSTHVLETGRAVMDMVASDLARLSVDPENVGSGATLLGLNYRAYWVDTMVTTNALHRLNRYDRVEVTNVVTGGLTNRVANFIESSKFINNRAVFTTHHKDRGFEVNEYRLYSSTNATAANSMVIGSLYKFKWPLGGDWTLPSQVFTRPLPASWFTKIADGVVHFQVRAVAPRHSDPGRALMENPLFIGSQLPTHVELELGVLEDKLINEISGREPNFNLQREFITNHLDRVHIFRQLIPIRNRRP